MRIAILTTSYPARTGDPAGHFVQAEARELARQGHQVVVLCPGPAQPEPGISHVRLAGAPLFGWPGALERLKAAPWRLPCGVAFVASARRELGRLGRLDRVIAHWIVPSGWPAALGKRPLTVVAHGSDVRLLHRLPTLAARHILRQLEESEARIRCVSEELRQQLLALWPKLESATSVEPSSMDLSEAPDRQQARLRLGLEGRRVVVIVGRLVKSKRTRVALSASQLIPNTRVVVVGDGPTLEQLQNAYPHATFTGALPRAEALTWIAAADVLLSASLEEGAPTAIREAMALGVDVVACPAGDLRHWAELAPQLWLTRGPSP